MKKTPAEKYRDLLLEHGIAVPPQATQDYDLGLLARSKNEHVANAVQCGSFTIKGPRSCQRCGQTAPTSDAETPCQYCPGRIKPKVMLILPPVTEVLAAVRDELVDSEKERSIPLAITIEELARRSGLEVGSDALEAAGWDTGEWWGEDDHPMDGFVHVIRGPFDFERESREKRKAKFGKGASEQWKKLKGGSVEKWKERILALLADGTARTFNAITVELSGGTHTADVAHGKDPDKALWGLVAEKSVEHTSEAPILFRARKR